MAVSTNQGRDIGAVLHAVNWPDLADVSTNALWPEVRSHPPDATCECPAVEVVARLLELGYVITPPKGHHGATESTGATEGHRPSHNRRSEP